MSINRSTDPKKVDQPHKHSQYIRVCLAAIWPRFLKNLIPLYSISRNVWRLVTFSPWPHDFWWLVRPTSSQNLKGQCIEFSRRNEFYSVIETLWNGVGNYHSLYLGAVCGRGKVFEPASRTGHSSVRARKGVNILLPHKYVWGVMIWILPAHWPQPPTQPSSLFMATRPALVMLVPGGTMSFIGGHSVVWGGGNENSSSSREWHRSRGHSRLVVTVEAQWERTLAWSGILRLWLENIWWVMESGCGQSRPDEPNSRRFLCAILEPYLDTHPDTSHYQSGDIWSHM